MPLAAASRECVALLANVATAAIVSGRHLDDLIARVNLRDIAYGGSHGLEIRRANGQRTTHGSPSMTPHPLSPHAIPSP